MSRYVGRLLELAGEESENPRDEADADSGLSDLTMLDFINRAQTRLQTVILRDLPHCTFFDSTTTFSPVASQREYDLPVDAFFSAYPRRLRFYPTSGDTTHYYDLKYRINDRGFCEDTSSCPTEYTIQGRDIVISPIPNMSSGTFKLTYVRRSDRLDLRRGVIESFTSSGGYYTSITLDVDAESYDAETIADEDHINVCDALGSVGYYNLTYSSFDSATGVVTLTPSTFSTSDGTIAIGNYITTGYQTTTHSALPIECDRYLVNFTAWKALKADSSDDSMGEGSELDAMEGEIVAAFSLLSTDIIELPILEPEWFEDY